MGSSCRCCRSSGSCKRRWPASPNLRSGWPNSSVRPRRRTIPHCRRRRERSLIVPPATSRRARAAPASAARWRRTLTASSMPRSALARIAPPCSRPDSRRHSLCMTASSCHRPGRTSRGYGCSAAVAPAAANVRPRRRRADWNPVRRSVSRSPPWWFTCITPTPSGWNAWPPSWATFSGSRSAKVRSATCWPAHASRCWPPRRRSARR